MSCQYRLLESGSALLIITILFHPLFASWSKVKAFMRHLQKKKPRLVAQTMYYKRQYRRLFLINLSKCGKLMSYPVLVLILTRICHLYRLLIKL